MLLPLLQKMRRRAGLAPGTLPEPTDAPAVQARITVIDYDADDVSFRELASADECLPYRTSRTKSWINVEGVADVATIKRLGDIFELHPLVVEDIVTAAQRPKFESFEGYDYFVLRMLDRSPEGIATEQVSLVLTDSVVLTFQERPGDVFGPVRERIRRGIGRIRKAGIDFLAYALIDALVDAFFGILEQFGERVEAIEEELLSNPEPATLTRIHRLRREALVLRRSTWPLREITARLEREETTRFGKGTRLYLRDLADHIYQVIESVESFTDILSEMIGVYLSSVSNLMNNIMKVLTLIATIFIPLTFIAGVYGMNFEYMPELGWRWGYFATLGFMCVIGVTMALFFKFRRWL